jgi:DNA-binding transcriptional LysR family regulator
MRSLNLDQLRALVEVIEQRSFSAAARRLNLTQPAVSLQVRELERRFGVQLVERLGRRWLDRQRVRQRHEHRADVRPAADLAATASSSSPHRPARYEHADAR